MGEPGGSKEYAMLDAISAAGKPVIALIVGRHVPRDKKMGHAGALVGSDSESAASKISALREAGAVIARSPFEVPVLIKQLMDEHGRSETA